MRNCYTTASQYGKVCVSRDERNLFVVKRSVVGGAEPSHHGGAQQQALCERRRRLPFFANRPLILVVRTSHTPAAQNNKLGVSKTRGSPHFANRLVVGVATFTPQRQRTASFLLAETKFTLFRKPTNYRWCGTATLQRVTLR